MVTNPLSVLTAVICCFNLKGTLQTRHTLRPHPSSQLLALQRGLGGAAGEQEGAGVRRGEGGPDVEPLARQSRVAAARSPGLPHGRRDALVPLRWGGGSTPTLLKKNKTPHRPVSRKPFTVDVESAGARDHAGVVFGCHRVPAGVVLHRRLDEETNVSGGVLRHAGEKKTVTV